MHLPNGNQTNMDDVSPSLRPPQACPRCHKVAPAGGPSEYTPQRATMILERGLCVCHTAGPETIAQPAPDLS